MGKMEDLANIVGKEHIKTDKEILESFKTSLNFISGEVPECVVEPQNLEDVQNLVRLANEKGFGLIPCSSKGNHIKGDTVPSVSGAVIVDLSTMNKIIRIDKRNKVAMVEPGVTFEELQAEVEEQGLRIEMPMLPRNGKSVLASLLDREPTTCPKYNWDAIDPLCCLELIFGTGDMFRTGNAVGPGTLEEQWAAGQAQKVSMGPAQTELSRVIQGSQGTMGIATWATIKLEQKPKIRQGYIVGGETMDALIPFVYKMLWRKLPDVCLILNRVDLAAIYGCDQKDLPAWSVVYSISGLEYLPEERLSYIRKDIEELAEKFQVKPVQHLNGISADKLVDIITKPCGETYWKHKPKGGCLDLFFLTSLEKTPEFITILENEVEEQGLPKENLGVYIQPIRHGTGCHLEFNLMYGPKQKTKAKALFGSASQKCLDMGGFFSRPHGSWADMVYKKCPDTVRVLKKVKHIFDPKGIMNPGKLCFGKEV
ncbi:MAG: FAD-binding oxidoreductase [Proteobacteria bacterium]|nr:FAD-binding oxidoreductase [Pseudomonadota bacterium]